MNAIEQDEISRKLFIRMLSDEEIARVNAGETSDHLELDEEYVDLNVLSRGVQRAMAGERPSNVVLPRRAVHVSTWDKLLSHLKNDGAHGHGKNGRAHFVDLLPPLREVSSTLWRMVRQSLPPVARAKRSARSSKAASAAPVEGNTQSSGTPTAG